MEIIEIKEFAKIKDKTAIAIGKFDGIHLGHRELVRQIQIAKEHHLKSVVFTFSPSPLSFFSKKPVKELTTKNEKRWFFEKMDVDYLVEYPFDEETSQMTPESFVKDILVAKLNVALVVAGDDLKFGRKGMGNDALLQEMAEEFGYEVRIIDKLTNHQREISSTYVRESLSKGNIELVNELLGQSYFVQGIVQKGRQIGRTIGFPTMNIHPDQQKLLPPLGVYFSIVCVRGKRYFAVTNLGLQPTVSDEKQVVIESNLFDFHDECYGEEVAVEFIRYHRKEKKFPNIEVLKNEIWKDVESAMAFFKVD